MTPPSTCARASRTSTAPTATALARYQNTSSLLLSQSQGCNFTRLAGRNRGVKGAMRRGGGPRRASGLSSATRGSGQKSPVFLIQNQGGKSVPDTQPINHRGYWCSGGAPGSPGTAISRRGTASRRVTAKNPSQAGRGKSSAQQPVTIPSTTRLCTWKSGKSPVNPPATMKATASLFSVQRRHDERTAASVSRQRKNGVVRSGGRTRPGTAMTIAAPKTKLRCGREYERMGLYHWMLSVGPGADGSGS